MTITAMPTQMNLELHDQSLSSTRITPVIPISAPASG